uniref:Uncharacterized protein n=1 Tax=Arundo donax TaxID=35708 RepID=A0A0A9AU03_ARUDO
MGYRSAVFLMLVLLLGNILMRCMVMLSFCLIYMY